MRTLISAVIRLSRSSRSAGGVTKILDFRCPHRKKSSGVKSGDLGDHSTGRFNAITRFPNSALCINNSPPVWWSTILCPPSALKLSISAATITGHSIDDRNNVCINHRSGCSERRTERWCTRSPSNQPRLLAYACHHYADNQNRRVVDPVGGIFWCCGYSQKHLRQILIHPQ